MTPFIHIVTGFAYLLGVGGLSAILARRVWSVSRPGALVFVGLVWMALSCGPHHLHWGLHLIGDEPTGLDTTTIAVALLPGVAWLWWQSGAVIGEGKTGWPGWWKPDRILRSTSLVMTVLVTLVAYCSAVLTSSQPDHWTTQVTVQAVLAGLYLVVSAQWWVGQFRRHQQDGVWSAKGVTLGVIWATCAMSHWSWAVAVGDGYYAPDTHMLVIDSIGIPAAVGFIALVQWIQARERERERESESGGILIP